MPLGSFPAGALAASMGTGNAITLYGVVCTLAATVVLLLGARAGALELRRLKGVRWT